MHDHFLFLATLRSIVRDKRLKPWVPLLSKESHSTNFFRISWPQPFDNMHVEAISARTYWEEVNQLMMAFVDSGKEALSDRISLFAWFCRFMETYEILSYNLIF